MSGPSARAPEAISTAVKAATAALYILFIRTNYAAKYSRASCADLAALTGQRVPGQVPGKTSRLDTATRMMIDADFSLRREVPREARPTVIRTPVNKRRLEEQK